MNSAEQSKLEKKEIFCEFCSTERNLEIHSSAIANNKTVCIPFSCFHQVFNLSAFKGLCHCWILCGGLFLHFSWADLLLGTAQTCSYLKKLIFWMWISQLLLISLYSKVHWSGKKKFLFWFCFSWVFYYVWTQKFLFQRFWKRIFV